MKVFKFLICVFYFWFFIFGFSNAQEKTKEEKYLTKGEAITMISATDFMKRKISELLSWSIGYDLSAVSRARLVPTFNYIFAVPKRVPPDGRTILEIKASVDDPGGISNIAGVRADLSSIGKLPNMSLVDSGLFGDEKAGDGIFTLQANVSPKIEEGEKEISVAAVNKKGWLAMGKATIGVKKTPAILAIKLNPPQLLADGKTLASLYVEVDNPGRMEDIESVTLDLSSFGYSQKLLLRNDGREGDFKAGDNIYSINFVVPQVPAGKYRAVIEVMNFAGGYTYSEIDLTVVK